MLLRSFLCGHTICPAWKYSEPNEPIYVAELAAEQEQDYFALVDLTESFDEEDDAFLPNEISQCISATAIRV